MIEHWVIAMIMKGINKKTDTMIMRRDKTVIGMMVCFIMMIIIRLRKTDVGEEVKMSGDAIENHMMNKGKDMTIVGKYVAGMKFVDEISRSNESNYLDFMALTRMDGFIEQI